MCFRSLTPQVMLVCAIYLIIHEKTPLKSKHLVLRFLGGFSASRKSRGFWYKWRTFQYFVGGSDLTNSGTLVNIVASPYFMCLALEIGGGCCVIIKQSESFVGLDFRLIGGSGGLTKISSHLKFRAFSAKVVLVPKRVVLKPEKIAITQGSKSADG